MFDLGELNTIVEYLQIRRDFMYFTGLVGRQFARGPGDRSSISGQFIPKT